MSCNFGEKFKITVFGQSHSEAIGVVIDGIPAGVELDCKRIEKFMSRRAPKKGGGSTERKEADSFEIISGTVNGITCGAPLCAVIKNTDAKPSDYEKLRFVPRPGHSDFTAYMKHNGFNDIRGGGNFSGRMTAPICFAGAVAMQLLGKKGVSVGAHIIRIGNAEEKRFDAVNISRDELKKIGQNNFPTVDGTAAEKMLEEIEKIQSDGDSVGGEIECAVIGLPVGLGEPIFNGVESEISRAVFSIPAVKGIEFGTVKIYGSENNDAFVFDGGRVVTETNNHGGILGGLSSGMPVVFTVKIKPTPSIGKAQKTVNLETMTEEEIIIGGRHDACILPRAVPCIEAAAAIALINLF